MNNLLRLILNQNELLVIHLPHASQVHAQEGEYWLTVNGQDICLTCGQKATIPAGMILVEGKGILTFCEQPKPHTGWRKLLKPFAGYRATILHGKPVSARLSVS